MNELEQLFREAEHLHCGPGVVEDLVQRAYNLGKTKALEDLDKPFGHGWEKDRSKQFKGQAFDPEEE